MAEQDLDEEKRQQLARDLECLTSVQLRALAGITEATEMAWRKRGTGPAYILFGTEYLYPRKAVAKFIESRVRGGTSPNSTMTL
jgi:hypothetical protein